MVFNYKLPDNFLRNNVKLLADLDKSPATFEVTVPLQNPESVEASDKPFNGPSRSPSPNTSNYNPWSISSSDYQRIREDVISGLLADAQGSFDDEYASLLFDVKSGMADTYGQHMVQYLCKDIRANYMEFNLDDLDNIGVEFHNQHKIAKQKNEEEEDKKKTAEKPENLNRDNVVENNRGLEGGEASGEKGLCESEAVAEQEGGETEDDQDGGDEDGDDEDDESEDDGELLPDETGSGQLAKFYFGTPKPGGSRSDKQSEKRNKKAVDTLFDTSIPNTDPSIVGQPLKQCNGKTPLVLYIYGIDKMFDMNRGWRFLSRLRDAIQQRRKAGIPIFAVYFWLGKNSCSDSRAKKKTGVNDIHYLSETITEAKEWRNMEGSLNRDFNQRKLKEYLRQRYAYLVGDDVIGDTVEWELEGMEDADSVLSRGRMDSNELYRITRSIGIRGWGKSKINIEDVSSILNKLESERLREAGEKRAEEKDGDEDGGETLTKEEKALRKYVIEPGQSPITYDDVIMDPTTKATVRQFVALSRLKINNNRSSLFSYFKMPGILLFGPPGTGKTHLCRAIANDSGHKFIALSAAELKKCYVGETEQAISAMFSLARKLHPCIIFLDEVDSLFYRRAGTDKSWERSALAQYLQEMDGLAAENSSSKAPLVIVATNRPGDLDEAFLRRLPYRVFLNIPSYEQRHMILERMIPNENLSDDVNLADIAKRAEGFSGSDLRTLCGQAALSWATELEVSTGEAFEGQHIRLSMKNFDLAFSRTGPSASPKMIETLENFHKRFQH
ncbi:hypothetical protein TWF730_006536 [Orbilia blumenaviensis]|uniref:AAA+ ATPase domain-containing protein n=1 Tax=Orbilia blumenaviensis TaxID=1796055 RepID=A0AAV9VGW7_9PEZI